MAGEKIKRNNKRLGRGIGSLLQVDSPKQKSTTSPSSPSKIELKSPNSKLDETKIIHSLAVENLVPNSEQPRKVFDEAALKDLTSSIAQQGIMQPIVAVKKSDSKYEIVAGERRWRAAQACGLKAVPVILKEVSSQNKLELAIIENIQRDDLNPLEEGEAYVLLAQKYKLTQKEIAEKVGKERATVANLMRITQLEKTVKGLVASSKLSLGHAKVLLAVEDSKLQLELAQKAMRLNLSVRATESMVKKALNPEQKTSEARYSKEYKAIEDSLRKAFGTKVKVLEKSGKGKLELSFQDLNQFNEIVEKLLNA